MSRDPRIITLHRRASVALAAAICGAFAGGCSKSDQPAPAPVPVAQASPASVPPAAPINTCSLLTTEEIAAVQGEAVVGTKPSQNAVQGLGMYDCFFTLPTFTNSITLSVTQAGPNPDARDPRQSWKEIFAAANAKASHKTDPAQRVEGLGEEAFWTGNDRMGALYVLKGTRYLRISVGGPGDAATKIQKCRTLAEAVMNKL